MYTSLVSAFHKIHYESYRIQRDYSMVNDTRTALPYTVKVGLLTKALRNLFGLSQSELAELSGLSRPTISRLEKLGVDRSIKSDTLEQLLLVFREKGVQIDMNADEIVLRLPNSSLLAATGESVGSE